MVQDEAIRIEDFKKLLDEFKKLPDHVERPPTFMEIAGYPHYENVCSNILAFFMDPNESHGFGPLILDALARVSDIAAADRGGIGNVSIEREVITDSGNRIDILIESDERAILIENKIYANVSNPFGDYANFLNRRTPEGLAKHKLLLTLYPTDEGSNWGFTNLTYTNFVQEIRKLLGVYTSNADVRHLTLFLDFLNTLENLQKGSRMNSEFVKLLSEQTDAAENLFMKLTEFRKELRKKVQELGALLDVREHQNVEQWFWRERTKLFDTLVHDIRVSDDLLVLIDAAISPRGWEIDIFVRGRDMDRSKLSSDRLRLRDFLHRLKIPFEERQGSKPFVYPERFAYHEDLNQIRPILQNLVDEIATSQGRLATP